MMNIKATTIFRRTGRWLPVLLLLSALALGPPGARANGGPGFATPVTVNGSAVNGSIGTDIERDWFSFRAVPYASYAIAVSTGMIWDCVLDLRTPDGVVVLSETCTVAGASAGVIPWTNTTVAGTFYLEVGGFAEFTTGSYQVAVSGGTFTDANANGLPDIWEMQEFGNLTNTAENDNDGDGLSNKDEYGSGTHPTNSASGLFTESFQQQSNGVSLAWQAIQYGSYRVLLATNLVNGSIWRVLGTNLNTDGSGMESYVDPDGLLPEAFYRVEYAY
jgi:hypothetical protein